MGRIQDFRMERAKRAFKEEMFPSDKSRAFYIDYAGNAVGFTIERASGHTLSYDAESGYFRPFDIFPEDKVVNRVPYEFKDGKIVSTAKAEHPRQPVLVLSSMFQSKQVDGHLLAGFARPDLINALKDAPIGTIITGVRDAPGSYAYGKYDFDTHIEKHGGHEQNYFAPVKTVTYGTWWTVDGAKKDVYDLANIIEGKSKYYALTDHSGKTPLSERIQSASARAAEESHPHPSPVKMPGTER